MNDMAAAPDDHEDILELQADLRRVLAGWDAAGADERDGVFARIVPVADDLVAAQQRRLRTRAEIRSDRVRDWAGRILFLLAALLAGSLVLLGADPWWLLLALPLLAAGIHLQISRRNRG